MFRLGIKTVLANPIKKALEASQHSIGKGFHSSIRSLFRLSTAKVLLQRWLTAPNLRDNLLFPSKGDQKQGLVISLGFELTKGFVLQTSQSRIRTNVKALRSLKGIRGHFGYHGLAFAGNVKALLKG
jgi:hypothetical protein